MPFVEFIFALGFVALGRWVYLNPGQSLDKFHPGLKPYSTLVLRFTRSFGMLMAFVGSYAIFASMGQFLAVGLKISTTILAILVAVYFVAAVGTTWVLLKRFSR